MKYVSRREFLKKSTMTTGGLILTASMVNSNKLPIDNAVNRCKAQSRKSVLFNFDWKFYQDDITQAQFTDYNDSEWRTVQLPHDWSIEGQFDPDLPGGVRHAFLHGGIGWYRKSFSIPPDQYGKKVLIQFDGVYMRSDVYINGRHVGFRPYGYVAFEYDITPYIRYNEKNLIAVRVNHSDSPTSRWYSGSGIYRNVTLTFVDLLHVTTWGVYVSTPEITKESAKVVVQTKVSNDRPDDISGCKLESKILDRNDKIVAQVIHTQDISSGESHTFSQNMIVNDPILWDLDNPYLYVMKTIVRVDDEVMDEYETPFGIRDIVFDKARGFLLNGKNLKMKGMNIHHDAGSLGAAVPDRVIEYRLEILKEFGVNAIRCSHNPFAAGFYEICDRLGFLVIDEAFDKWASQGYYADYFDDWWEKDLDAMVLRDRNHPCIVMWSVGNEVREQNTEEGVEILKKLISRVHEHDETRPVTCSLHPGHGERIYSKDFAEAMDVVCYNYQEPYYEPDRKAFPDRIILGGECYPYFRGKFGDHRDYNPVNPWYDVIRNDYVIGQFLWTGIDYLGESSGWPSKGWCTGLIDVCGFLKPRSYFHRSVWNNEPMVGITVRDQSLDIDHGKDHWQWPHLAAHWNFAHYTGHVIQVETVTNCTTVELIVNGHSFGVRNSADYLNATIIWYIPFRPGVVEAIGRNNNEIVSKDRLQTSGKPARIKLTPDREIIQADGQDVSLVKIQLLDEDGILVPDADVDIHVEVKGNGRLIGLDNGDLRSHTPFKSKNRKTYWGKALAIVQSERVEGTILVIANAVGLPSVELQIRSSI